MNTPASSIDPTPMTRAGRSRRLGLFGLGAVVILGGLIYTGYWFRDARYFESTDDAYVNGDVVQITSEVPGTVLALKVDDTQTVTAGQALLSLDPADAKMPKRMRRLIWRAQCDRSAVCSRKARNCVRRSNSANKVPGPQKKT